MRRHIGCVALPRNAEVEIRPSLADQIEHLGFELMQQGEGLFDR